MRASIDDVDGVGILTPERLGPAAALRATAFFRNPAHVYICPESLRRLEQLEWLLHGNLRIQPDLTQSFCLVNVSEITAMRFWTTSETPAPGALRMLRAGLLRAPSRLGIAGTRRMFEVTNAIDRQRDETMGDESYGYLNNMAVREDLRGRGIGGQLLRNELDRIRAESPDRSVALSTQREENVTFYRRLGFRIASQRSIGVGPMAFENWVMVSRPQ